jgi:hypothetical protein
LKSMINEVSNLSPTTDINELYCQVLEHKWYLSEIAQHDVGHQAAVTDFIQRYGQINSNLTI